MGIWTFMLGTDLGTAKKITYILYSEISIFVLLIGQNKVYIIYIPKNIDLDYKNNYNSNIIKYRFRCLFGQSNIKL